MHLWPLQWQDQVARKVPLTGDMLEDATDGIRTAVAEAYPNGAPEHDPVWQTLDDTEDLTGTEVTRAMQCNLLVLLVLGARNTDTPVSACMQWEELQLGQAELWFANRKLPAGNKLSQHVGRNEKTKVKAPQRNSTLHQCSGLPAISMHHLRGLIWCN